MPTLRQLELLGVVGVVLALLAFAFWPAKPVPEVMTAAPQVVQADHSIVVERAPDAHPAPPPHLIPRGGVEVRRESFVAAPAAGASSVQVDLSLVRMPDNGQRVIASSPDGTVVSALDIPIEAGLIPPPPKPWAAGLSYGTDHAVGIWVDRDVGRLVLGAQLARAPDGRVQAQLRVGARF